MNAIELRPRSATELVDAAFQLFRRNPVPFMLAAAIIYIPWLILRQLTIPTPEAALAAFNYGTVFVMSAVSVVVYAIASGVVMLLTRDEYLGKRPDVAGAYRAITGAVVPLVIATILVAFGFAVGLVLFILPFFYLMARWFAVRQTIVLEHAGIGQSFSRAWSLSSGAVGHILGTILLGAVLLLLVSVGAAMIISLIPSPVLAFVISAILSVTVYPFFSILETLLYYDMRIRKEGFDIEYFSSGDLSMGAGGPAA